MNRVFVVALLVGVFVAKTEFSPESQPPLEDVIALAGRYVASYQERLTAVIAEETQVQRVVTRIPADPTLPRARTIRGDVYFMFSPVGEDWLTVREVAKVDGSTVAQDQTFVERLAKTPLLEVAAAFKEQNSRFNLGRIYRNFSEPTLSLSVLAAHRHPYVAFESVRHERRNGVSLHVVRFTEREGGPALIRDLTHGDVLSSGELALDTVTGAVHRAVLRGGVGQIRFELTTEYTRDSRLDMLVPTRFLESYEHGSRPRSNLEFFSAFEEISVAAQYSNFRLFRTTARIKVP